MNTWKCMQPEILCFASLPPVAAVAHALHNITSSCVCYTYARSNRQAYRFSKMTNKLNWNGKSPAAFKYRFLWFFVDLLLLLFTVNEKWQRKNVANESGKFEGKKTHGRTMLMENSKKKISHAVANYRFIRITAFNFIFNLLYYHTVFFCYLPFFTLRSSCRKECRMSFEKWNGVFSFVCVCVRNHGCSCTSYPL